MQYEVENRRTVLMELMSSVLLDVTALMNAAKFSQAAELVAAFEYFPSLVSGNLEIKTEHYCSKYVLEYDLIYSTSYVQKILICSYKFPELLEKMNKVYPDGFYQLSPSVERQCVGHSLHEILAGLNGNSTGDGCDRAR